MGLRPHVGYWPSIFLVGSLLLTLETWVDDPIIWY